MKHNEKKIIQIFLPRQLISRKYINRNRFSIWSYIIYLLDPGPVFLSRPAERVSDP